MQPAALGDVVAQSATDGVVLGGVAHRPEKLGQDKARRRARDVFAVGPPAVVIGLPNILVRAGEQGDVLFHPGPGFGVGDVIDHSLLCHSVEVIDVVPEGAGFEHEGAGGHGRGGGRRRGAEQQGEDDQRGAGFHGHRAHLLYQKPTRCPPWKNRSQIHADLATTKTKTDQRMLPFDLRLSAFIHVPLRCHSRDRSIRSCLCTLPNR